LSGARLEILDILLDDRKIAARRKDAASAGDDRGIDARIPIHVAPDLGKLAMQCRVGGVHAPVLHRDAENLLMRAIEFEPRIAGIGIGHRSLPSQSSLLGLTR